MAQVGYLGIVLPESNFWQGYFIDDEFAPEATKLLKELQSDKNYGSTVFSAEPHISATDQPVVGSLCGALVELAVAKHYLAIGACAHAIRTLVKHDYFWIEGRSDTKGVFSEFHLIDAPSIDTARDVINSLPAVLAIKIRLLQNFTGP